MRWLCILLPDLALELFTRGLDDPDRPAVVIQTHEVVSCNAAAAARGVRRGSSRASARAICPELLCIERNGDALRAEAAALQRLAGWAYGLTATVSPQPPDALLLEIEGSLRLFGGQKALQARIQADLAEMAFTARLGIAHTPMAALLLARAGTLPGPCPLAELRARVLRAIDAVPLSCGAFDTRQRERLEGMGIHRFGALLKLPRQPLTRRFGPALMLYLDRLTGRVPEPRRTITPSPTFHTDLHFLEDVTAKTALYFPMRRQLAELTAWLRSRQLATDTLVWHLRHGNHGPQKVLIRLARPEIDAAVFFELTRLRFEQTELLPAVASLRLAVRRLVGAEAGVAGNAALALDSRRPGVPDEDPFALVGRLDARLGDASCHGVERLADHRPEYAFRPGRPGGHPGGQPSGQPSGAGRGHGRSDAQATAGQPRNGALVRPTWLLQRPLPLQESAGGLYWQGPLTLLQGPERIDAAWWENRASRDYYIAGPAPRASETAAPPEALRVDASGGAMATARPGDPDRGEPPAVRAVPAAVPPRYWIYRDLKSGGWFLHGLFG